MNSAFKNLPENGRTKSRDVFFFCVSFLIVGAAFFNAFKQQISHITIHWIKNASVKTEGQEGSLFVFFFVAIHAQAATYPKEDFCEC